MGLFLFSLGALAYGYLATWLFEYVLTHNKKLYKRYYQHHEILFGYHVHHSTYGLLCFIATIILLSQGQYLPGIFVFWFGVGIIIKHTVLDGKLVFIERQRK